MMIERLLLTLFLTLFGLAVFLAFRYFHLRRARKVALAMVPISDRPTVMYFRSDSCAPCRTQAHYLQNLEEAYGSRLAIQKIDADKQKELAGRYGVFTLPTTLILDRSGEVQYINYGLTATNKLAQQMEKVI
jgi:thioredoxin 1